MSHSETDAQAAQPTRRRFVQHLASAAALGTATTLLPDAVLADPYQPWSPALTSGPRRIVRVRGSVRANGRGLARVAVSDGVVVVDTDQSGRYELVTTSDREHVFISVPRGHRLPVSTRQLVRHFQPIAANAAGEARADFTLEPLTRSDDRHGMLVLADIQTENAAEMARFTMETLPDLQRTIAASGDRLLHSVSCGDIVFDQPALFDDYERAMQQLGIPAFQVIGNHDLDKDGPTWESGGRTFRSRFGPSYYSFTRGRVHYVVLDNVFWHGAGYIGYLDATQLAWLEQDLARVERGAPVVVLLHIPVEGTRSVRAGGPRHTPGGSTANREYLYKLLAPFKAHLIAGHTHDGEHLFVHGTHAQISGTVCGAWWTGGIAGDGTPNGYAVYDADDEQLTWRYKATGFGDAHQIRAYARGAVPEAPHEIVANIWDWDPTWRVVWYEGGDRRGIMMPRVAIDPLARETLTPTKLPERHRWVTPFATEHLLFAPVDSTARGPLRIEATDRFGRTYSAEVPRA